MLLLTVSQNIVREMTRHAYFFSQGGGLSFIGPSDHQNFGFA